jgi:ABC-type transporter Mla subunit MlaD
MQQPPESRSEATKEDGLGRLIDTEARIAAALAAAEADAAAMLESARKAAESEADRFGELVEADLTTLATRVAAERDTELSRIAAEAERRGRRLHDLPEEVIEELAGWVVAQLLDDPGTGTGR